MTSVEQIRAELIRAARGIGAPEDIEPLLERPRESSHGDWATNVAMVLAKPLRSRPRDIAERLRDSMKLETAGVSRIEIAGPGFMNFWIDRGTIASGLGAIIAADAAYGTSNVGGGRVVNVEFVSANPTGPLHVGHGRQAALGDAIATLLEVTGWSVTREFYYNDAGVQIDNLTASVEARINEIRGKPSAIPEGGYHGEYIKELAERYITEGAGLSVRSFAVRELRKEQDLDLQAFGVKFDHYFLESSLYTDGMVEQTVKQLASSGRTYENDGALWLRTTDFGDDKDRVVIKSDGAPAYVAADIAYYLDKRERGFDLCIYMLGADHHGYIARLKAIAAALGEDPATVEVLIGQMVNLVRDGQPVRMSKRAGTVITLDDLVEAIGVDAARYSLIRSSVDTPIDIDLELWSSASNENPVYYVQYAHARLAALARNAAELGLAPSTEHLELLTHEKEGTLIRNLGEFPRVLKTAADLREPHRVSRYLEDLAGDYHRFYDSCRVLPQGDEAPTDLHAARLALCQGTRQVIANGLAILGVTAPERM